MQLAKPRIDVGLFTNRIDEMLAFWQREVGLAFDHMLPLGSGRRQHRHELAGSVMKINHARYGVQEGPRSGYRELVIAREGLTGPVRLTDPDGNRILLVPPATDGVERIGIRLGVRDPEAHRRFYVEALQLPDAGPGAVCCGDSLIRFAQDPEAPADAVYEATGFRYVTIQVLKTDAEHAGILARGGVEGRAPVTLGTTARISFVRDPDGNWIEISQRASLTGSVEA